MYVDSQAIKDRFESITDEDMAMLRSKNILLGGQSHSALILDAGLKMLAMKDKKYEFLPGSYHVL